VLRALSDNVHPASPELTFSFRCLPFTASYLTLNGALEAGLSASVAKQKLEYMVLAYYPCCHLLLLSLILKDSPTDGSVPRRKAFELKEIYGCDMLKPTECVLSHSHSARR
jgi:hypothetical protein